jgi:hypothetical protein
MAKLMSVAEGQGKRPNLTSWLAPFSTPTGSGIRNDIRSRLFEESSRPDSGRGVQPPNARLLGHRFRLNAKDDEFVDGKKPKKNCEHI